MKRIRRYACVPAVLAGLLIAPLFVRAQTQAPAQSSPTVPGTVTTPQTNPATRPQTSPATAPQSNPAAPPQSNPAAPPQRNPAAPPQNTVPAQQVNPAATTTVNPAIAPRANPAAVAPTNPAANPMANPLTPNQLNTIGNQTVPNIGGVNPITGQVVPSTTHPQSPGIAGQLNPPALVPGTASPSLSTPVPGPTPSLPHSTVQAMPTGSGPSPHMTVRPGTYRSGPGAVINQIGGAPTTSRPPQ
jgi:hypothetical protein